MAEDKYNQDELFAEYWQALADDRGAIPPANLDPKIAHRLRQLPPPDPDAEFVARLGGKLGLLPFANTQPDSDDAPLLRSGLPTRAVRRANHSFAPVAAMGAMLLVLAVGTVLLSGMFAGRSKQLVSGSQTVEDVVNKAKQVSWSQLKTFDSVMFTETEAILSGYVPTSTLYQQDSSRVIQKWYQSADIWRTEFAGKLVQTGASPRLLVSDGTYLWNISANNAVSIEDLAQQKLNRQETHALSSIVSQADPSKCTPKLIGTDKIAERDTYIIELGSSKCMVLEGAAQDDDLWQVWLDQATYLELKSQHTYPHDGSTSIVTTAVTNIVYDVPIDPAVFTFRPADDATITDNRPDKGITWYTLDELRQRANYPIFIPTYLPNGYLPTKPIMNNSKIYDGSTGPDYGSVLITYHAPNQQDLLYIIGPATAANREDYLNRGVAVTLANGIVARLEEWNYPHCDGRIVKEQVHLYWEQDGALIRLVIGDPTGVTMSKEELYKIAVSIAKDAQLGETAPLPQRPTVVAPPHPTDTDCGDLIPAAVPTDGPMMPNPQPTSNDNS